VSQREETEVERQIERDRSEKTEAERKRREI
jgi:hypothetical protein